MGTNSEYCSNIKELSKYLRISYGKASDLAKDPSFPKVFIEGKAILKTQVTAWLEQRINLFPLRSKATSYATRAIHKKA